RGGDAIIGRAPTFMLRPRPMGDAVVRVRVAGPDVARFATGLRRDPEGGYVFAARELGEASFTAFGAIRRAQLAIPGSRGRVGRAPRRRRDARVERPRRVGGRSRALSPGHAVLRRRMPLARRRARDLLRADRSRARRVDD